MANKPSYSHARKARGTATMTIEPAPKTSFLDKNLEPHDEPPKGFTMGHDTAKPGGSISPEMNMPDLPELKRNPTGIVKT
jgi:hypothetical protein